MKAYSRPTGEERGRYLVCTIELVDGTPVANLDYTGPVAEGAQYPHLPPANFPVPDVLLAGQTLANNEGVPFRVMLEDAEWDERWGVLI